jgi:hypothetical protein
MDEANALIALRKKINTQSLTNAFSLWQGIPMTDITAYNPIDAAHFASVWIEVIRNASETGVHRVAVDSCHRFLGIEFETLKFDAAVEIECEAAVYGIISCSKIQPLNPQFAV